MIRINLLRNRKEGLQGLVAEPGGTSSFVSGREVLLAALFLVLGGAILWFVLGQSAGTDPDVVSGNAEAPSSLSGAEASVTPAEVAASSSTPPVTVQSAQLASPPPSVPTGRLPSARSTLPPSAPPLSASAAPVSPRGSTLLSGRGSTASAPVAARAVPPVAGPSGSGGVITMKELRILGEGNSLQILAATDGRPEYNMFRVDNPDRVVIDLPGVRHEIPRESREQRPSNSIVTAVRVAQNQIEPPMVRLVLEVEAFPVLQVLPRPDGLLINITGQ